MRQLLSVDGRSTLLTSLVTTAVLVGFKILGLLEPVELLWFDHLSGLRSDEPNDPRLLIVGMTEGDIQQYGWPLSDDMLADTLQRLQDHRPSVIGLDLYRSSLQSDEILPPETSALRKQLAADNLIAIMNVGSDPNYGDVPPPPTVPEHRIGFNDLVIDPDGVVRRSLLFVKTSERHYYSFALRTVLAYLQVSPLSSSDNVFGDDNTLSDRLFHYDDHSIYIGTQEIPALQYSSGGYQTLDSRGYQTILKYRSRQLPAQHVSISQVLSNTIAPESIANKIVLVGTTAPSLKDQFYTPYSAGQRTEFTMSGVVMHAQIISQLLDTVEQGQALYRFMPQWGETFWLFTWCAIAGVIVWRLRHPVSYFCIGSLSLLALMGIGAEFFSGYIWLPIAEPMIGIIV
ncbi:MAG: CHASE2 domain-containing protein, partial [Symploca sp. SIO2B6]|nr:CHASE2 domain-containing protein [Symploca sp. SIO2B6]